MRIAHYNTHAEGGSAVLMERLHAGLQKLGIDSRLRHREGAIASEDARRVDYARSGLDRFLQRARYSAENRLLRRPPRSYFSRMVFHRSTPLPAFDSDVDIIHLHWVSRWLDLASFVSSMPAHIRIVWSIHDMSALAGGCFLHFGCASYGKGCGRCPLLRSPFDRFLAAAEVCRRSAALAGRRVLVVANSDATRRLAERSEVFEGIDKETIYPGLELDSFTRHPKPAAREQLGIDLDTLVLGFGAAAITDPNKGLDRVFSVAADLSRDHQKVAVLLFGDGQAPASGNGIAVHHLGRLSSPAEMSLAYSAMDVFLLASEMETFGQVSVEAQACGTPVWAFRVGGVPETMVDGSTGCLFPFPRTDLMGSSIREHLRSGRLLEMGDRAERHARANFSSTSMADAYLRAYSQLLQS